MIPRKSPTTLLRRISFGLSLAVSIAAAQVVEIADPGLESAIRTALGKPTGEITAADMESITELRADRASRDASYGAIKSLRGIEAATNLLSLGLGGELGPFQQSSDECRVPG
jgi:hypothetical protein